MLIFKTYLEKDLQWCYLAPGFASCSSGKVGVWYRIRIFQWNYSIRIVRIRISSQLLLPIYPFTAAFIFPSKATSATDGCRDARELISDGVSCPLARLMGQWLTGGHAERSFARHADKTVDVEIPPHKYQCVSKFYTPTSSKNFGNFLWVLQQSPRVVSRIFVQK